MLKSSRWSRRTLYAAAGAIFCLLSIAPLSAHAEDQARQTVRVGYFSLDDFQEYDASSDTYRGYSYDYMMAVAQYAGWDYEFVPVTYDEGLEMLKAGSLDLMNYVEKNSETEAQLGLSSLSSGESWSDLVVNSDNATVSYEDFSAIGKLTVGLNFQNEQNSAFIDYCKDNDSLPTLIYYRSDEEVRKALSDGEIDAYIVSSLSDTDMRTVAKFAATPYYFATAKDNKELLKELNAAMASLHTDDPYFSDHIYSKYHSQAQNQETVISASEKEYVSSHGSVTVSYIPDWYPMTYEDGSGACRGAMIDLLDEISARTGLTFQYRKADSAESALEEFRSGSTELIAGFPYDFGWAAANHASVSVPFESVELMRAYVNDAGEWKSAAVPQGSYQEYLSRKVRSGISSYSRYADTAASLKAVQTGTSDCTLMDSLQAVYYQKRYQYRNIRYQRLQGTDFQLSLAVSDQADPRLLSILNKAIDSIGSEEITNIVEDALREEQPHDLQDMLYSNSSFARWFYTMIGFVAAAGLGLILYNDRMQKKNAEIQEAVTAKSEFLSNMSHDMRTPLNGIIGYTNLALKENDSSRKNDYLDKVRISGDLLLNLINDTLDISKIESGKYVLKKSRADTEELLQSIIVPIQAAADQKHQQFSVNTERMYRGTMIVDSLNLKKIILNLLSNAVKYTPEGGKIELLVAEIPPESGCNCMIQVRDNGIGISEEFQKRMFEPFTQERSPQAKGTAGTGLGLSIVKRIVTLMGGIIRAESVQGSGTTFTVLIPIEHAPDQAAARTAEAEPGTLEGRRILLCEDNEMNLEIATEILKGFSAEVVTAENGQEGAAKFAGSGIWYFDLILMDLRMPVMDGIEAAGRIRQMPREDAKKIPIIAMTADAYPEDIERCRQAGMNAHVIKPIDADAFQKVLLAQCRARDQAAADTEKTI